MAFGIVDLLEPVQIDEQNRTLLAAPGAGNVFTKSFLKRLAVDQASEFVEVGFLKKNIRTLNVGDGSLPGVLANNNVDQ